MQRISKVSLWRIIRRHYLVTIVVTPIVALLLVRFWCVGVILPVSGRVVDAVTGKPIKGIPISLEVSRDVEFSTHHEIHGRTDTNNSGLFWLSGTHFWPGFILSDIRDYVVRINQGPDVAQAAASAEGQVVSNPKGTRIGSVVGNKAYFPLNITFDRRQCNRIWPATCTYRSLRWGITVRLIPVLSDPSSCQGIDDPSLRENCRQLNTFRSAFLHMDKTRDIASSEQICDDVDHGRYSDICRYQIAIYHANQDPD